MTTNVLIVYATELGNTGKMAERVAEGARSVPGTQLFDAIPLFERGLL